MGRKFGLRTKLLKKKTPGETISKHQLKICEEDDKNTPK